MPKNALGRVSNTLACMATPSRRQDFPTAKRRAVEADVLRATEGLLSDGAPYADLAVERIAREAGLSRTAFYFYFKDKRDLLMRLTEGVTDELYAVADRWWSGDAGPARLDAALQGVSDLFHAHGPLIRAIIEVAGYDAEVSAQWRTLIGRFVEATRVRLEHEQRAGGSAAGADPAATAFALVWMTERTLHQSIAQGDLLGREAIVDALERIWRGAVYG